MFKFLADLYYRLRGTHSVEAITASFHKQADALDSLSERHRAVADGLSAQSDDAYQQFVSLSDQAEDARTSAANASKIASRIRNFAS